MGFEETESTVVDNKKVSITVDGNFAKNFQDIFEILDIYEDLEVSTTSLSDLSIDDLLLITIDSQISELETNILINKNNFEKYSDSLIRILEKSEKYELCSVFFKLKNKYINHKNEK